MPSGSVFPSRMKEYMSNEQLILSGYIPIEFYSYSHLFVVALIGTFIVYSWRSEKTSSGNEWI